MGFVNRQVIIAFTLGLAIMAVTSNLSRNCEIHIASSSSHGNGKAVPPQKQSIDTIPACQQNDIYTESKGENENQGPSLLSDCFLLVLFPHAIMAYRSGSFSGFSLFYNCPMAQNAIKGLKSSPLTLGSCKLKPFSLSF